MDQKRKLVIQGGGVYLKKAVRFLIAGAIIAAVAVGFYLIGYKTAYDRIEEGSSGQAVLPQTFYAEITDISGELFTVDGLEINDINFRGDFTFSIFTETELVWRGNKMRLDEFSIGDTIAISFTGAVQETYPGHIQDVIRVQLLDDEKQGGANRKREPQF